MRSAMLLLAMLAIAACGGPPPFDPGLAPALHEILK
jgi:predicted small lipoprotein YifL